MREAKVCTVLSRTGGGEKRGKNQRSVGAVFLVLEILKAGARFWMVVRVVKKLVGFAGLGGAFFVAS